MSERGADHMMKQRHICERAIYDSGMDDPRMLVYWYQQRVRTELLANARRPWWTSYASPLSRLVRALVSPAPRRTAPARRVTSAQAIF